MQTLNNLQITGFILAGGQSRRMGQDKALLAASGQRLIDYPLAALGANLSQVHIVCGDNYAALASHGYQHLIRDNQANCGPLEGIFSAFTNTKAQLGLFLPVDMPRLGAQFVARMIATFNDTPGIDILYLQDPERNYPLCGIYSRKVLELQGLKPQNGRNFRPKILIDTLQSAPLQVDRHNPILLNCNTAADLKLIALQEQ